MFITHLTLPATSGFRAMMRQAHRVVADIQRACLQRDCLLQGRSALMPIALLASSLDVAATDKSPAPRPRRTRSRHAPAAEAGFEPAEGGNCSWQTINVGPAARLVPPGAIGDQMMSVAG